MNVAGDTLQEFQMSSISVWLMLSSLSFSGVSVGYFIPLKCDYQEI